MTRVCVCVCSFNGAGTVGRAIESVLAQTFGDFELIVADDCSDDGTVEVARAYADPRMRVLACRTNLGNAANRSRAILATDAELVKFVDQDDWISPACLEEHVRLMDSSPALALTFSRRALALDASAGADAHAWATDYAEPHHALGVVREVHAGASVLESMLAAGLHGNPIGEPTAVMVRRACLRRSGLFNRALLQTLDLDLWLRLCDVGDVGFIDAELATRAVSAASATGRNRGSRRDWLDRLWMLEGLRERDALWEREPRLAQMLATERRSLVAATVTGRFRTARLADALTDDLRYARFLAARRFAPRRARLIASC